MRKSSIAHTSREALYVFLRRSNDCYKDTKRELTALSRRIAHCLRAPREAQAASNTVYLIYTMGKVASMSVLDSLIKRLPCATTYAMHYLTLRNLQLQEQRLAQSDVVGNRMYKDMHAQHAAKILNHIKRHPQKQIKIITLIREPFEQIVSQIFQQLNLHDIDSLKHMDQHTSSIDFDYAQKWLDEELLSFSGMDLLRLPFDTTKGYGIYQQANISLLVIRFEDINRVYAEAMAEFTHTAPWTLGARNVGNAKPYALQYKKFKQELEIAPELLDQLYSSDFVRHFYNSQEIDAFKRKWGKGRTEHHP